MFLARDIESPDFEAGVLALWSRVFKGKVSTGWFVVSFWPELIFCSCLRDLANDEPSAPVYQDWAQNGCSCQTVIASRNQVYVRHSYGVIHSWARFSLSVRAREWRRPVVASVTNDSPSDPCGSAGGAQGKPIYVHIPGENIVSGSNMAICRSRSV
jgi:hypothetical protein